MTSCGEHPVKHLSGYQGWVHADGYAGFNGVFGEGKATEVACMAHIRRKFVDVFAAQGSAIAGEAIKRIAQLYGVEKQARGQSPEARAALRQENAKPIFDDLEEWLRDQLPKISGKSPLAKAIRYALGRMPKTRPYLDNGFLELDQQHRRTRHEARRHRPQELDVCRITTWWKLHGHRLHSDRNRQTQRR